MRSIHILCVLALFTCLSAIAQQNAASAPVDLSGMQGLVSIMPNPALRQTTIAFTSNTPLADKSSQIVFVAQSEEAPTMHAWAGMARVLVGKGAVVIVPADVQGSEGWAFTFSGTTLPDYFAKQHPVQTMNVYGIARYGETVPLSPPQIVSLATTGYCCGK